MKKNIIILLIGFLIIIIGMLGLIIYNNRTVSTVTLDINPSIKINLNKNNKVKNVVALNMDAKKVISKDLKGNDLDIALKSIINNVINKGYIENKQVEVLLSSTGNVNIGEIEHKIKDSFGEKEIYSEIIVVTNITKEHEKLAKEYNISPAKAAYISSVIDNTDVLDAESLINKPVKELVEIKNTGNYCDEGYVLEGDFCFKKIGEEQGIRGMVCPDNYYEYKGKCYEEVGPVNSGNLICKDDFILENGKCIRTSELDATPSKYNCTKGEALTRVQAGLSDGTTGDANDIICVDKSNIKHPISPCNLPADDPTERMTANGKCYWHRKPVLPTGCPGSVLVNGYCWDDASNVYICQNSKDYNQYTDKYAICIDSIKYYDPIVTEYSCSADYTLNDKKCIKTEVEDTFYEMVCPTGFTDVDDGRCINTKNTANKTDGYKCEKDNSKLFGSICYIYEIIEAKRY